MTTTNTKGDLCYREFARVREVMHARVRTLVETDPTRARAVSEHAWRTALEFEDRAVAAGMGGIENIAEVLRFLYTAMCLRKLTIAIDDILIPPRKYFTY